MNAGRIFGRRIASTLAAGARVKVTNSHMQNNRCMKNILDQLNSSNVKSHSRLLSAIAVDRAAAHIAFQQFPAAVSVGTWLDMPALLSSTSEGLVEHEDDPDALTEETKEDDAQVTMATYHIPKATPMYAN